MNEDANEIRKLRKKKYKLEKKLEPLKKRYKKFLFEEFDNAVEDKETKISSFLEEKLGKLAKGEREEAIGIIKKISLINQDLKNIEHSIFVLKANLKCDFCNKSVGQLKNLIVGKRRTFCEECWQKYKEKDESPIARFWAFLKEDSWQSWIVSLVLLVVLIRFILFPTLSFITGSPLPLVVIESCSLYHETGFEDWWSKYSSYYEKYNMTKEDFESFQFKNGLNKGDVIFVWGRGDYEVGDIIIFQPEGSTAVHPIIHRVVYTNPFGTKGDNGKTNPRQLDGNNVQNIDETSIPAENIIGKASFRIPLIGWLKLVFYEPFRAPSDRGFCGKGF